MRSPKVYPVMAALILDQRGRALLVPRSTKRRRHPGVVSLATARLTPSEAGALVGGTLPVESGIIREIIALPSRDINGQHPVSQLLRERILARKLATARTMRERRIRGRCAARLIWVDDVGDLLGRDGTTQRTVMITLVVQIEEGEEHIIAKQRYYSDVGWFDLATLRTAYQRHDAQMLFPHLDPFQLCIGGACMASGNHLAGSKNLLRL